MVALHPTVGRSVGRSDGRTDGQTRALHARPPAWTRNYVALGSPLGVVPCPRAGWPGGVPTGTQTGASEGPCQALYVIIGAYVLSAWPKRGRLAQIPPHEASASCSAPTLPSRCEHPQLKTLRTKYLIWAKRPPLGQAESTLELFGYCWAFCPKRVCWMLNREIPFFKKILFG